MAKHTNSKWSSYQSLMGRMGQRIGRQRVSRGPSNFNAGGEPNPF